tara:strand:+ start:646 stop:1233 length:588 start_codon:yes stop_codon:yes gene_type:complete
MSEEEIFDKPVEKKEKAPRKKRELSEAQKAALAKGRAKMAEKRAAAKAGKSVNQIKKDKEEEKAKKEKEKENKKLAKESKKGEILNEKQRKTSLAQKRRMKKQQDAFNNVLSKQKKDKILDEYNDKKCAILSRCTNVDVFNKLSAELDDITEEDILSEGQSILISKLRKKLEKYEKEDNIKMAIANNKNNNSKIF